MKTILTFLYVEDESQFEKTFIETVENYFQNKNYKIQWRIYHQIHQSLNFEDVDACFFDIVVDNQNLLDVFNIHQIQVPVIFVSQFDNYIYECVHYQIFDYIRKTHLQDIVVTLDKLVEYYTNQKVIVLKVNEKIYKLDIDDIVYIKIESHHMKIHQINGENIDLWKGYRDVFKYDYPSLLRVHRSYVMNIHHCLKIDKTNAYLKNTNEVIPVSHRYLKKIQKNYLKSLI